LGYQIVLEVQPPEHESVVPVVQVEDIGGFSDAERILEVVVP
jgi:hypothetical protein